MPVWVFALLWVLASSSCCVTIRRLVSLTTAATNDSTTSSRMPSFFLSQTVFGRGRSVADDWFWEKAMRLANSWVRRAAPDFRLQSAISVISGKWSSSSSSWRSPWSTASARRDTDAVMAHTANKLLCSREDWVLSLIPSCAFFYRATPI